MGGGPVTKAELGSWAVKAWGFTIRDMSTKVP
jgi:hypothetical protein